MSDKSYVTMEQHQCIVCGQLYDTGSLLLDLRLKPVFDRHTITGNSVCPRDQKHFDDGYIALIEVTNTPTTNSINYVGANRTGRIAHIQKSAAGQIFDIPLGDGPMAYVEQGVIDILEEMQSRTLN